MTETRHNKVAIITAMAMEMQPIARQLRLSRKGGDFAGNADDLDILATVSGMGALRAVQAFERLVKEHQPDLVVLAGFSGALDPFYRPGYTLSGAVVCNEGGETVDLDTDGVTLLTVDQPAASPEVKRSLYEKHDAAAVDMESFAVARAAASHKVTLRIVRTISDGPDQTIPPWAMGLMKPDGTNNVNAAMAMLLTRPTRLGAMLAMRRGAKAAAESLGPAVAGKIATWFATMMHDGPDGT